MHAQESAGNSISFTFSPPADTRYTETVRITRQRQAPTGGVQTEELTSSSDITIRQNTSGWEVVVKPREHALKLNGRHVLDPFADLQSQVTITHRLDKQGRLINTDIDYAALMNLLGRELPPQELAKVTPMVQQRVEELKQKAAAEWNARVGEFIGKTVKVGDVWQQEATYTLPEGRSAGLMIKTEFAALEPSGAGTCVRIRQMFSMPTANGAAAAGSGGTLSRLVDPRTMLIYDETSESSMRMERESRVYEFDYGK